MMKIQFRLGFLEKNSLKFGGFEKYSSEIQQKIIKSWELIFELDFYDEYITHKPGYSVIE